MEATTQACRNLTAPGLSEIYGRIATPKPAPPLKRLAIEDGLTSTQAMEKSPAAKKRARTKANKAEKAAAAATSARKTAGALLPPPSALAIEDRARPNKGTGKAAAKAGGKATGKGSLPKNIKPKTEAGKMVCYAYNKGEQCVQTNSAGVCTFEHVCWWCGGVGCAKCQ